MHETRLGADELGKVGQKGDDVVLGDLLDLADPLRVELGLPPFFPNGFGGFFGMTPISARASQACASISNQIRNRLWSSQIEAISGRE